MFPGQRSTPAKVRQILNTLPWQSSQLCAADASPHSILPMRHIGGSVRAASQPIGNVL